MCSMKWVFLKILQNLQETSASEFPWELQATTSETDT